MFGCTIVPGYEVLSYIRSTWYTINIISVRRILVVITPRESNTTCCGTTILADTKKTYLGTCCAAADTWHHRWEENRTAYLQYEYHLPVVYTWYSRVPEHIITGAYEGCSGSATTMRNGTEPFQGGALPYRPHVVLQVMHQQAQHRQQHHIHGRQCIHRSVLYMRLKEYCCRAAVPFQIQMAALFHDRELNCVAM